MTPLDRLTHGVTLPSRVIVVAATFVVSCSLPIAVSAFPDELYQAPRSWLERAYPKLIHYNKLDKGGHFAAWEQPKPFVEELRAGFKSLR